MSLPLPPGGSLIRSTLWPYRLSLAAGLGAVLVGAGLALAWPWLLQQAVDGLASGEAAGRLHWQALGVVALAAAEAVCRFLGRYLIIGVSRRAEFDLRERLFAHLLTLDATYFQQARTGDLMARATNDLSAVRQLLGPGIQHLFNTVVLLTAALLLMARVSPGLALGAALLLPSVSLVFGLLRGRIEARFSAVQTQFAALNAQAEENLAGIRVVKSYAQEDREIEAFRAASREYQRQAMAQVRVSGQLWPAMGILTGLATVMLIGVGGREVLAGRLTLGQFVQLGSYLTMLAWPMIALGWVMNLFQQGLAALKRVQAVFDSQPRIVDHGSSELSESKVAGAVEFRGVGLRLGETWLLRDCSFSLPAGGTLGIAGPTGSGKSLLLALLARLYDPTEGRILLDGRDLRDWPLGSLRRQVGFVPQETILFSATLRENLALGLDDQQPEDGTLGRVVAVARLDQDLPQFPAGLDTLVGERGVTLSGGQKQRTAIARALLKEPAVLVLDDALSSVDSATEVGILEGLRGLSGGHTSVVATHRLSAIREADLILVLVGGGIVERGTHQELMARGGLYSRLERLQRIEQQLEDDAPGPANLANGRQNGRQAVP